MTARADPNPGTGVRLLIMAKRGNFAFDLSRPLKKGTLLKQGGIHKAFKHRFFVLYPGFLVYYDDATKWKLDMTRGETLGVSYNFEFISTFCTLCEAAGGFEGVREWEERERERDAV